MSSPFNTTSSRFRAFCDTNNDTASRPSMDTRPDHIPTDVKAIVGPANDTHTSLGDVKLQCCCGRPECAFLENNNTLLGGIERDLETAARLGQALLHRHESYVSESQAEHKRLNNYIDQLERERFSLQTANEKIVEENRQLLTQLESANTSLKDSDSHVKSLESLLRDCEVEVRRLNGLTRRAEELELRVLDLEKERLSISQQADDSKEETRSTIKRWKESEVKVRQLEREVQRIEWDAKKDRERYEEIVARLERERVLERELGGAEGRLKGAAALQGLNGSATRSNVVSHFVRDILQDNANLQAGIAELRELLQTSNEEVQNLREQILQHQPIGQDTLEDGASVLLPLSDQLDLSQGPRKQVQQEVHVHHHYHAKIAGKRERTPTLRKSRRRGVIGLGVLPSTPESSAPTTPMAGPHRLVSSPVLPIALHQPQPRYSRWSVQSAATGSSMMSSFPSSPRSYYERSSSIFDRLEAEEESSRPTSPESGAEFASSPFRIDYHKVELDDDPTASSSDRAEIEIPDESVEANGPPVAKDESAPESPAGGRDSWSQDLTPKPSQILMTNKRGDHQLDAEPPEPPDLPELSEQSPQKGLPPDLSEKEPPDISEVKYTVGVVSGSQENTSNGEHTVLPIAYDLNGTADMAAQPRLRRSPSQDSLVSISGMDIHIAKRPNTSASLSSTNLLRGNKAYFALSPSATRRFPSAQPLTTVTEFTALSSMRSFSSDSTDTVLGVPQSPARPSVSVSVEALSDLLPTPPPPPAPGQQAGSPSGFGRLVGGWVRGKWGIAPMKSSADLRSSAASASTASSAEARSPGRNPPPSPFSIAGGRLAGINQRGPIPGLRPPPRILGVQVKMVDQEGLTESLAE